ncbi:Uncharacterized membrane-anchored protein [Rhizobium sp. RU20A]|uniref:GDYXXLXY domain-containing protein n=1 Tax=Rhizobium sp. RU20A TaxID=1907412 RepID=UPI00095509CF|nr:GDYXXLXY domain-containing protein [Rhizobium sp. RU20A]SIQ02305.1 Uncharacterized membrane-anchored protein [Rhizobium sp. RU20A]
MSIVATAPARKPLLHPLLAALLLAVLQTVILFAMISERAAILRDGTEIRLRTAPVDPRDLLRGDYVILSYDISTISADRIIGPLPDGTEPARLYVRLSPGDDGFWQLREASFAPLQKSPESVVLLSQPFAYYPPAPGFSASYVVPYGIERYYVPEGEGRVLEEARNAEALSVIARVSDSGTAQIAAIVIDGKPVYEEPLY